MSRWSHTHNVLLDHATFQDLAGAETRVVPVCWGAANGLYTTDDAAGKPSFEVTGQPRRAGSRIDGVTILALAYRVPLPVGTEISLEIATPYRASQTELAWGRVAVARARGERFDHLVPIPPAPRKARVAGAPGIARWHADVPGRPEFESRSSFGGYTTGEYAVEIMVRRQGRGPWIPLGVL